MADSKRSGWSFAAGLMVGGAVALWASLAWLLPAMAPAMGPGGAAGEPVASSSTASPLVASPATAAQAISPGAAEAAAACGAEPVLAPAGARDGRFTLDQSAGTEPPSLRGALAAARDAARQGRLRDSEVALLAACRQAAAASPPVSVPVADVQSLLGQRYLEAAGAQQDPAVRAALLERSERLLERSLLAYTVVLGSDASKSRLAARRVAALAQLRERHEQFPTAPDGAAFAPDPRSLATLGASAQSLWPATPGGDSSSAHQTAALIRSDPELTQLEADLARLQAQAASVARDPDGLRRRSEQALAQRNAQCRDKACLSRWYAQRKRELFAEF